MAEKGLSDVPVLQSVYFAQIPLELVGAGAVANFVTHKPHDAADTAQTADYRIMNQEASQ